MTRAFIFPGQGSQAVGMGKALADAGVPGDEGCLQESCGCALVVTANGQLGKHTPPPQVEVFLSLAYT